MTNRSHSRTDRSAVLRLPLSLLLAATAYLTGYAYAESAGGAATDADVYRIGVPDLLEIRVWEQEELSGNALVRTDGRISVPLVGDIQAEGRTPEELAALIESDLAEFVANPQVDVAVLEMRSQVVSVIGGGIERSGVIELRHEMRVVDAIAEMGGFTPFAKKARIKVLRKSAGGEIEMPFDYPSFVNGRAPGTNFLLMPGDTIIVPE